MRFLLSALLLSWAMTPLLAFAQQPPSPQAEHELLAREVGVWDAKATMWMAPGAEPMKTEAVETNEMFGSFWLSSAYDCSSPAFPFKGRMLLGYDPVEKTYNGMWVDTMSPYGTASKGSYNEATETLTLVATARDMMSGEMKTTTMVSQFTGEDTKVFTIHAGAPGPDGKPAVDAWKMMEIEYTRRK